MTKYDGMDMARMWRENSFPRIEKAEDLNDEGIQRLAEALCYEAANDYRSALDNIRKARELGLPVTEKDLDNLRMARAFFESDMFALLTGLDGRAIIDSINREFERPRARNRSVMYS